MRCRFWGQVLFSNNTFYVLNHHDGIIDQQPYRQHHAKHRERVNRKTGDVEYCKGSEDNHRNGDSGDKRRTETLQKQIHDEEYQNDCLDQSMKNTLNRNLDKRRGVIGINGFHTGRKPGR